MTQSIERKIVRNVQADVRRAEETVGTPTDKRRNVPVDAIHDILKSIEENDQALRFLANT